MASKVYPQKEAPIPVPDLENWNLDREVDVPVMVRGSMYKSGTTWYYWDGTIGNIPVTGAYYLVAKDLDTEPLYLGYANKDGEWYIRKLNTTTTVDTFVYGVSGFSSNWTNRASLSYDTYDAIF